jgi:two-component system CheB/CheR fusion protein
MIDGLLAYSRINSMGKPLRKIPLLGPINEAMLELESTLKVNDAKVIIDKNLPSVFGDRDQLKSLFFHLIENAIKFRSEETPEIRISSTPENEDTVAVSVEDNGIGVDERNREEVFTIFKRLGIKENTPGTGIGLAICRRIVLRHHGRIVLASQQRGVKITCSLRTGGIEDFLGKQSGPHITEQKSEMQSIEAEG